MPEKLEAGDVLLTSEAPLGEVAYLSGPLEACLGQRLFGLRAKPEVLDCRYLFYLLQHGSVLSQLHQRSSGTTVAGIRQAELVRVGLDLPDLATQSRVAGALSTFDDLIENNRRRIEILEEMARLLYREWFVHFRFPGHQDVELVDSELGPIPADWAVERASALIESGDLQIGDGYRAKNAEMTGGPLRFLRVKNVQEGYFADLSNADSFPSEYTDVAAAKCSRVGDVAIAMKGSVGRLARVDESTPPLVYSPQTSYWRSTVDGRLSSSYLYEWMQGPSFVQQCAMVKGATDMADYVNLTDQRNMKLLVPVRQVLACFGEVVDPLLDLSANLRQQNRVLREARDLLLPRLVSGELDVSELDLDGEVLTA